MEYLNSQSFVEIKDDMLNHYCKKTKQVMNNLVNSTNDKTVARKTTEQPSSSSAIRKSLPVERKPKVVASWEPSGSKPVISQFNLNEILDKMTNSTPRRLTETTEISRRRTGPAARVPDTSVRVNGKTARQRKSSKSTEKPRDEPK